MKKFRALILSTMMAILAFVGLAHIGYAAENNDEKFTITDITTSTNKVENGGKFRIDVSFKGTSEVKPGDKLVIPLPKTEHGYLQTDMQFSKPFDATYQGETIKDVGTMSVEGDQIVLTFNDNVTQLENGFYGTAWFEVVAIITSNGSEGGPITIPGDSVVLPGGATFPDITVEPGNADKGLQMTKTGRYTADGQLEWTVGVDVSRELLDKAGEDGYLVITDKLGYDLPINWDSLQVKASWMIINEEMMYLTKDADNKGFTIRIPFSFLDMAFDFIDVDPLHITITYQAGEMEDLVDGMTYDNVANASLGGASSSANADYTYHIAGSGGIDGDSSSTVVSTDESTDTTTTESAVSSDVEESTTDTTTDVASSDLPTTTTSTTDAEESTSTDESTSDSSTSTTEVNSSDLPTTTTSTSADIELPVVSDSTDVTESTGDSTTDSTSSTMIDSSNDSTTDETTVDTTVSTSDDIINLPINKVTSDSSTDTTESTTSTSDEEDSEDPEDPNKEDSTEPTVPADVTTDDEVSDEEAAVIVTDKKVDTTTKKVDSTTKSNNKHDQDLPQTGTEQSALLVVMGMGCILLGGYLLKKRN